VKNHSINPQSEGSELMSNTTKTSKPAKPAGYPAQHVLGYESKPLDAIFAPKSVALIGATEKQGSVGRTIMWNLLSNPFGGTLYPINPQRPSVLGIKTYPSISAVPEKVDLAIIVTPAPTIPDIVGECVD